MALGTTIADLAGIKSEDPLILKALTAANISTEPPAKYENDVLTAVEQLVNSKPQSSERLAAAQRILVAVLNWHLANRPAKTSSEIERQLSLQLLKVRTALLQQLARQADKSGEWQNAHAFANDLKHAYPTSAFVHRQAANVYLRQAEQLAKTGSFVEVRTLMSQIRRGLPLHPGTRNLDQQLQDAARKLMAKAGKAKNKESALALLDQALDLSPQLPSLRDQWLRLRGKYQILWVAVNELPKRLSPATAKTVVEKQVVELLFESLVQNGYRPGAGAVYRPRLAHALPVQRSGKLHLELPQDARWSTGEPITTLAIRHTAEILAASKTAQRSIWIDQIKRPRQGGNLLEVDLEFRHAVFDPLAFLQFKILPRNFQGKLLLSAGQKDFAENPVGSGPYQYQGQKQEGGRSYRLFSANPYYARAGHSEQPYLREIRFFVPHEQESGAEENSPIHLWFDVTAEKAAWLKSQANYRIRAVPNRRVHFLAVNHRRAVLRSDDLRRGLAAAINRRPILDACYRGKISLGRQLKATGAALSVASAFLDSAKNKDHHVLNGPYPFASWAAAPAPRVPARLWNAETAVSLLQRAAKTEKAIRLSLKCPANDSRALAACQMIVRQVDTIAAEGKIDLKINLAALKSDEFFRDLDARDFDLAYTSWNFANDFYALWPMFDPRPEAVGNGGSNFLGYDNDAILVKMLKERSSTRDFSKLRDLSHDIHSHCHDKMPLIPLWQLDTYLAVHPRLQIERLGGEQIFSNAAIWMMR